jgi:hypothetical protein
MSLARKQIIDTYFSVIELPFDLNNIILDYFIGEVDKHFEKNFNENYSIIQSLTTNPLQEYCNNYSLCWFMESKKVFFQPHVYWGDKSFYLKNKFFLIQEAPVCYLIREAPVCKQLK